MKKTLLSIIIALILTIIITKPAFAEVTAEIYDGHDFTMKETSTIIIPEKGIDNGVIIEIQKDIVTLDSPYQYNYGISIELPTGIEIEKVQNLDTAKEIKRRFTIKNVEPNQEISYTIYYNYYNARIKYNLDIDDLDNYKYDKEKFAQYLKAEEKIESTSTLIKNKAKEVVGDETNPFLKAKKIFAYVNTSITYDMSEKNKGALNAIKTGKGVCEDYADLFVAMCRAEGIPARVVFGQRYFPNRTIGEYTDMKNSCHAWVEFYVPNEWIIVEVTDAYKDRTEPEYNSFAQDSAGSHIVSSYSKVNPVEVIIYSTNMKELHYYLGGVKKELSIIKNRTELTNIIELINKAKNNNFDNIDELNVLVNNLEESLIKDKIMNTIETLVMVNQEITLD